MESTLYITVQGCASEVRYGKKKEKIQLGKKPILWSIGRVVADMRRVQAIRVEMQGTTFSGTRQVIATVNTIAWALGIKVNGKKQMSAEYDREPNITMPKSDKRR